MSHLPVNQTWSENGGNSKNTATTAVSREICEVRRRPQDMEDNCQYIEQQSRTADMG